MKKENLHQEITEAVRSLLEMAREVASNNLSDNCQFFISEIEPNKHKPSLQKVTNKTTQQLSKIIDYLEALYPNLYDVNLHIYKAYKNLTLKKQNSIPL